MTNDPFPDWPDAKIIFDVDPMLDHSEPDHVLETEYGTAHRYYRWIIFTDFADALHFADRFPDIIQDVLERTKPLPQPVRSNHATRINPWSEIAHFPRDWITMRHRGYRFRSGILTAWLEESCAGEFKAVPFTCGTAIVGFKSADDAARFDQRWGGQ